MTDFIKLFHTGATESLGRAFQVRQSEMSLKDILVRSGQSGRPRILKVTPDNHYCFDSNTPHVGEILFLPLAFMNLRPHEIMNGAVFLKHKYEYNNTVFTQISQIDEEPAKICTQITALSNELWVMAADRHENAEYLDPIDDFSTAVLDLVGSPFSIFLTRKQWIGGISYAGVRKLFREYFFSKFWV